MNDGARCPIDFELIFHDKLSDSYEMSQVLLATAHFDGTLQLLTSGWERVLGYGRAELRNKTLAHLMWSDRRSAAAAVAAILDRTDGRALHVRVRCRNGQAKCLRLNRLYDKQAHLMYVVAEEIADSLTTIPRGHKERRLAVRQL